MLKVEAVIEEKDRQLAALKAALQDAQRRSWELESQAEHSNRQAEDSRDCAQKEYAQLVRDFQQLSGELETTKLEFRSKQEETGSLSKSLETASFGLASARSQLHQELAKSSAAQASLEQLASELAAYQSQCKSKEQDTAQDLRKAKERISELEDTNSKLLQEIFANQNEMRLMKQEYEALKMLKEIEIMQIKSARR